MRKRKATPGDVVQSALPDGRYAYGRLLRDAGIAIYATLSDAPAQPPVGSREYLFTVWVYDDVPGSDQCPVVGHDPSRDANDDEPPPSSVEDPISGEWQLYYKGRLRPSTVEECRGLEPAAVWNLHHIVGRIMESTAGASRR